MKENDFKSLIRPHVRALRQLRLNMEYFLEDVGNILVYSISERVKTFESAIRKSHQQSLEVESLDDLVGLRCVVATNDEIEILVRFLSRMQVSKDLTIEKDRNISRTNGYRARHLVVKMPGRYERSVFDGRVEIQLLTIFQHSFNYISRAWVYKSDIDLNNEWSQRFQKLSQQLEQIETEVNQLHKEVVASSVSCNSSDPLTPLAVKHISKLHFNEDVSLDDAVDFCRAMVDLGCDTTERLWQFVKREDIAQFRAYLSTQIESRNGQLFQSFMDMPQLHFWSFFGPRMHEAYNLIGKLAENLGQDLTLT